MICRVNISHIPPHHPRITKSPPPSIIRRLRTLGRKPKPASPNPSCNSQNPTSQCLTPSAHKSPARIHSCALIFLFGLTYVALSLFLGIFFTLRKEYGRSMGDAWTLASYVVGVGGTCTSVMGVCHYPHCTCWSRGNEKVCTE